LTGIHVSSVPPSHTRANTGYVCTNMCRYLQYTYTFIHTICIHVCIWYVCTYTCMYMYVYVYDSVCACVFMCVCVHTQTLARIHTCIHIHVGEFSILLTVRDCGRRGLVGGVWLGDLGLGPVSVDPMTTGGFANDEAHIQQTYQHSAVEAYLQEAAKTSAKQAPVFTSLFRAVPDVSAMRQHYFSKVLYLVT